MSRTSTFGSNSVTYPDNRVFAFSPYKCIVTGTAPQQAVVFTFNGKTLTRYTGSDNKVTISLTRLFQSFFVGVETGVVSPRVTGKYANTASKLIQRDKKINVAIGANNHNMSFDIMYGALQQGETEPTEETIYRFGSALPLTITQNSGSWCDYESTGFILENNTFGKDIDLQEAYGDNKFGKYRFVHQVGEAYVVIKEITVVEMPVCPESYYLRWIDRKTSSYKYYNFLLGKNNKATANGATFNYNVLELDSVDGLYKNSLQTLEKISTETITVVEPSADLLQQEHIISIFDSPKVWLYMGSSEWMEVNTSESSFEKIRNDGKKEIQVNIILPQKYNIRL